MGVSILGWTPVREFPSDQPSEESYIRNDEIQRISIVEDSDSATSVLVHAFGSTYLAVVVGTWQEAHRQLQGLAENINGAQA